MFMTSLELNALIGSRICHDLISPLGAIGNGIELLTMSGVSAAPEITLISESVDNANARIRFFRIAFGAASDDALISHAEVTSILADVYRGNRTRVDWRIPDDTLRAETKLAFLVIQCFESALPWGGKVVVTRSGTTWSIYGNADRMKIEPELWKQFETNDEHSAIVPSNVHFALVKPTAEAIGRTAKAAVSETAISVSF
jgi:histidine phosphotransferase ChpT